MSHVTAMKLVVNDLDAMALACQDIGVELVLGQTTHKWYGRWVNDYAAEDAAYKQGIDPKTYGKCEHAIRIPGNPNAYEVGLVRNDKGQLVLAWDNWCGGKGLAAKIGDKGEKLKEAYNYRVGQKEMLKKGFKVEKTINAKTGKIQMRAWRYVNA